MKDPVRIPILLLMIGSILAVFGILQPFILAATLNGIVVLLWLIRTTFKARTPALI